MCIYIYTMDQIFQKTKIDKFREFQKEQKYVIFKNIQISWIKFALQTDLSVGRNSTNFVDKIKPLPNLILLTIFL